MKNDQIKDRSMLNEIVQPLTDWYRQNKRILPWRDQNNAYYTWVSEIMLQQTRVEAVKPYFQRFIGEPSRCPGFGRMPGREADEAHGRSGIL